MQNILWYSLVQASLLRVRSLSFFLTFCFQLVSLSLCVCVCVFTRRHLHFSGTKCGGLGQQNWSGLLWWGILCSMNCFCELFSSNCGHISFSSSLVLDQRHAIGLETYTRNSVGHLSVPLPWSNCWCQTKSWSPPQRSSVLSFHFSQLPHTFQPCFATQPSRTLCSCKAWKNCGERSNTGWKVWQWQVSPRFLCHNTKCGWVTPTCRLTFYSCAVKR